MKAVKVMGTIDERGQLTLDHPLSLVENSRVEVIILMQNASLGTNEATSWEDSLSATAEDSDIQGEIADINAEFAIAKLDKLADNEKVR
jgi:hypothetical protein